MRLVLDHHLSPVIVDQLLRLGCDVVTVHDRGWSRLRDHDLLAAAADERRAVVTADVKDFVPLARVWAESQREHWGLLLVSDPVRSARLDGVGRLVAALTGILETRPSEGAFRNRVHWL